MRAVRLAIAPMVALGVALLARAEMQPAPARAIRASRAPAASESVVRGREVYSRYGCAMCHGADGKGGFANANAETDGTVPAVVYVAEGYTRAELKLRLLDGTPVIGKADSKGPQPPFRMPGWRGQMTETEVSDLVEYLFGLQPKGAEAKWR